MEMILLPILAILGRVFLVDGGDDEDASTETQPDPDLNRESFGEGDDTAAGSNLSDFLFLNGGDDMASGGLGDDKIFLGEGQDQTTQVDAEGNFSTEGMEGDDLIRGGTGRDDVIDTIGSNTLFGDTGYDRLNSVDDETSQDTADTVFGGFGEDVMFVDDGDTVTGGGGDDRFQVVTGEGDDAVIITDFEEGDTLYLRDGDGGFVIQERISTDLTEDGTGTNVMLDGNVVVTMEGVTALADDAIDNPTAPPIYGSLEDDVLTIGQFGDRVIGFDGDDTIAFAEGEDTEGRDMDVVAGSGDDTVTLGLGDDSVMGGLGADTIFGGGGVDEIDGGYGDDIITSTDLDADAADTVFGGAGDDTFFADSGDALVGGTGVDEFNVDLTAETATAVAIDDFDAASEQLNISVSLDLDATPTTTFEVAAGGIGTNVVVDDTVVALLIGVDPNALDDSNVTITNVNTSVVSEL